MNTYYNFDNNSNYEQQGAQSAFQIPQVQPKAAVRKKSGGARVAALALCFSLLGGAVGTGGTYMLMNGSNNSSAVASSDSSSSKQEKPVVLNTAVPKDSESSSASDKEVTKTGKMTAAEVYKANVDSTVGITTSINTNYFGYKTTAAASGSGFIISKDGYIVTNYHVIDDANKITVTLYNGKKYQAELIGGDEANDVAVLKIEADDLKPAELGNSDETIVGETVIAVGNPAGLSFTVTDGIVSHIGRKIRGKNNTGFEMECIQTNAEISPGNSGGALVNMYGQVIGITSSKLVSSTLEGLGFAISINEALPIIEELIDKGYIEGRFRIGVSLIDTSTESKRAAIKQELGYDIPKDFKGIYVGKISDDSDIKNTSMKVGDFFTEVNGKTVTTYSEFYDTISSQYTVGDKVPATCAHIDKNGEITYYHIEFGLIEDKSGDY